MRKTRDKTKNKIIAKGKCGDNLKWMLDNSGVFTVSGEGKMYDYDYYYNGKSEYRHRPWMLYNGFIQTVVFEHGVSKIGRCAFFGCAWLSNIIFPKDNTITTIGEDAFAHCSKLTSVILPEGLKRIHSYAFNYCSSLTSITIPGSVKNFGFRLLESLKTVVIHDGVETIGKHAFVYCKNLSSVIIPQSVTFIDPSAFQGGLGVTLVCVEGSEAHRILRTGHWKYIFDYQYKAFNGVIPPGMQMLSSPFDVDEETPFLFVSYSHKDRDAVLKTITTLYESGWRIWYDEGLTIGDRYDETLEEHVKNASAVLLFDSENSANSLYINQHEIPWAIQYGKPVVKCIIGKDESCSIDDKFAVKTVLPSELESSLAMIDGLTKGEARIAKGIYVAIDPSARKSKNGKGFAYCLYASSSSEKAMAIMTEAKDNGCRLYDAVEFGNDEKRLKTCESLIVFLDRAFLSDANAAKMLIDAHQSGMDISVCQLEELREDDLPKELEDLWSLQWLNFVHSMTPDMHKRLARHLEARGCRNTAVLPGLAYKVTDAGIVIERYTGWETELRIESEYGGIPVVGLEESAFKSCIHLKKIFLPDGIDHIPSHAFENCIELISVSLPKHLLGIGESAFANCTSLPLIALPDSVITIGRRAFYECKCLAMVSIQEGADDLTGSSVCSEKDSIPKIGDIDGMCIGIEAFCRCSRLKSVALPPKLVSINDRAFSDCADLASIVIPGSITSIGNEAFSDCWSLSSIVFPDSVVSIGYEAFSGCESIASITIPSSVTSIGKKAFYHCESLKSITMPSSITRMGENIFGFCNNLEKVVLSNGIVRIWDHAFSGCDHLTSIAIPDSVTSIGDGAFGFCYSMKSISLPDTVEHIGHLAFLGCKNLTVFKIPHNVNEIGSSALNGCRKLNQVTIPDSVSCIEPFVFCDCTRLRAVTIPNSIKSVMQFAFMNCNALLDVYFCGSKEEWLAMDIESYGNKRLLTAKIHYNAVEKEDGAPETQSTLLQTIPARVWAFIRLCTLYLPRAFKRKAARRKLKER